MVFHWSLSDSKFSQVFRSLLGILTDLINAAFKNGRDSSTNLLFLQSFFSQDFGDCSKNTSYNWYHHYLHVPSFFFFGLSICLSLGFLLFSLCCPQVLFCFLINTTCWHLPEIFYSFQSFSSLVDGFSLEFEWH